ncbi:MAG TPA: PAS domain S-box protein [Pedobacter sp.]|uniref:PAS domain S-box protein n=1 Tax=Pedobacter sp. TaxID=1411316 RepID=UPI002BE01BEB|nr:PAS domain S-box protein [Pedobacter sp.]HMI02274.1 PAS domain S-box protein [Pedobacter sp.]
MKNYGRLFNESPAPMYIYDDRTYDFLAVNDAALHQYGYSRKEFLSMNATQIRPSHEIESFTKANLNVPDSYFDFGIWQHTRKNGDIFYVHIYAHRTKFNGRDARSVLAVDVEQKVRTEMALSEKSAEIIDILESITDGFYALNKNWEVTYFNKTAEKVLGCKREEVIGKNLWDFFPHSREGKFFSEYERAMTEKVSVHFEEEYAPLGVWGSMNVYPTKDGIAVYFVDITEQKKIQQKISNDERSLRAIINNTTDIIWSVDRQNNIISANDAFRKRIAWITGKTDGTVNESDFDKDLFLRWQQYFERAFKGEAYKIILEDEYEGKEIFEEISFNPIRDINDEIIGISCFSRDITTQHLYLRRIEKQNAKFKEIAWSQSHEVRAPLSNIMGLTALFNFEDTSDPGNAKIMRLISNASQQLDDIIKKISAKALQTGWDE